MYSKETIYYNYRYRGIGINMMHVKYTLYMYTDDLYIIIESNILCIMQICMVVILRTYNKQQYAIRSSNKLISIFKE